MEAGERRCRLPRLALAGLLALAVGCTTTQGNVEHAMLANRLPPAHQQEIAEHYVVGCPDILEVTVEGRADVAGRQRVGPDGRIFLGALGRVRVEGRSCQDLSRQVAEAAGVPPAAVHVQVAEYRSERILIFGEVKGLQRAVPYRGQETVFDLLQRVGGITLGAELNNVYVVRAHVADGRRPEVFPVDLKAIVLKNDTRTNLRLEPFDQVYIGTTREASVVKCLPPVFRPFYEALCGMCRVGEKPARKEGGKPGDVEMTAVVQGRPGNSIAPRN